MNRRQGHSNIHDLFYNILHGSLKNIEQCISRGGYRDMTGPNGRTFLIGCIEENYLEKFKYFLKIGCDINKTDAESRSPLYNAILIGRKSFTDILLQHKCDVNIANVDGLTPLMCCVESADFESLCALLGSRCLLDCRNDIGETALHIAVSEGHADIVKILIESGADVNIPNNERNTPIVITVRKKMKHLLHMIISKCEQQFIPLDLDKSLLVCCDIQYLYGVDILLKYGANPFAVCAGGTSRFTNHSRLRTFRQQCAANQVIMELYCIIGDRFECSSPMSLIDLGVPGIILVSIIENYGKSTLCSIENKLLCLIFEDHKSFMFRLNICLHTLFYYGLDRMAVLNMFPCDSDCPCRKLISLPYLSPEKRSPLCLLLLTRNMIRSRLDTGITRKAHNLKLPKALENIITLKAYLH